MAENPSAPLGQMVQCQVTGEWVPADETVVIDGKRVSAKGKQLLLAQLRSGEAMPGELEVPGKLRRIGCSILDNIIMGVAGVILGGIVGVMLGASGSDMVVIQQAASLVSMCVSMAYFTILHGMWGQTVGKKAGKIKVVNLDGSNINTGTAFIRALCYAGLGLIAPAFLLLAGVNETSLIVAGIAQGVFGIFSLANAITALVSKNQRALHDMLAGTRVIQIDV